MPIKLLVLGGKAGVLGCFRGGGGGGSANFILWAWAFSRFLGIGPASRICDEFGTPERGALLGSTPRSPLPGGGGGQENIL